MSIVAKEIIDYQNNAGVIGASEIDGDQLSATCNSGQKIATVYDTTSLVTGQTYVISDGTNTEEFTISTIDSTTQFTATANFQHTYAKDTAFGLTNNLFPNITAAQSQSGVTLYEKFFRKNTNASISWTSPMNYIPIQVANAALSMGFGVSNAADTDGTQGNMTAFGVTDNVQLVSDGADTRTATIVGISGGLAVTENVVLTGATLVNSVNTYSKVLNVSISATDAARTVTVKEKTAGTTRGTIGINKIVCWLWFGKMVSGGSVVNAEGGDVPGGATIDSTNSILYLDIAAGANIPIWCRYMCAAGSAAAGDSTGAVATSGSTT